MQSFPFTSQVTYDSGGNPTYDRAVDSEVFRNVLKNYYNNGVFALNNSECFLVEAPTAESMVVTVLPGSCMINGATAYDKQETELTLSTGGAMDRIDTIVLRFNDNVNYRNISLAVVEGTPATTPVAPTLTRSDSIFELGIANILVPANSTAVSASRITDTRQDSERCGYVSAIQELDVTDVFNQFQNALNEYLGMMSEEYDEWLESFTEFSEEQQAAFMEWFENLQYVLDGDVAGHLQNEIDDINDRDDLEDSKKPWGYLTKGTSFAADGSIVETDTNGTTTTVFNADGTITETWVSTDNITKRKTTTFNADGSISETVVVVS